MHPVQHAICEIGPATIRTYYCCCINHGRCRTGATVIYSGSPGSYLDNAVQSVCTAVHAIYEIGPTTIRTYYCCTVNHGRCRTGAAVIYSLFREPRILSRQRGTSGMYSIQQEVAKLFVCFFSEKKKKSYGRQDLSERQTAVHPHRHGHPFAVVDSHIYRLNVLGTGKTIAPPCDMIHEIKKQRARFTAISYTSKWRRHLLFLFWSHANIYSPH